MVIDNTSKQIHSMSQSQEIRSINHDYLHLHHQFRRLSLSLIRRNLSLSSTPIEVAYLLI
jgi:hypothetical protein